MSQETRAAVLHDCREAFADTLIALARDDERIVAVCNDSVGSSNLAKFKAEFPDRMINVGIAEQDLVGVAAGLANGGLRLLAHADSSWTAIWTCSALGTLWCHSTRSSMKETPLPLTVCAITQTGRVVPGCRKVLSSCA